ncbi:hypothetical protein BHE74_00000407 [Ensete ventricosum]|nr:hypothetical protein BHE74_00000407 [Ensete ventricosum]
MTAVLAEQLLRLTQSKRSTWSDQPDSWLDLDCADSASSPVYVGPQDGLRDADKITALPGQPGGDDFDQYAGHVTVDPKKGRALFYYFVESPHGSSSKPLVLWLNGGDLLALPLDFGPPAASFSLDDLVHICVLSDCRARVLLSGIRSHGRTRPFQTNTAAATVTVANVLFLESPAGVGFSYSNTTTDYDQSGDKRTAEDTFTFLLNWLERFPHYKNRTFFIAGESYAGHYVPQLASLIMQRNKLAKGSLINLSGIAVSESDLTRVLARLLQLN